MSDRKTYYELVPSGVLDYGRTVRYGCPLGERCCSWVHDARRTESLGAEGSALVLVNGVNTEPWKDGVAQHVLGHLAELHGTVHWLLALGDQEDAYEKAAAGQNRENERAWHAARSAQESLQEARSELADTRLGLSELQGLMSRVEAVLERLGNPYDRMWAGIQEARAMLSGFTDPHRTEPQADPQPVGQEFLEFLENARAKEDGEPQALSPKLCEEPNWCSFCKVLVDGGPGAHFPLCPARSGEPVAQEPCSDECAFLSYTCGHGKSGGPQDGEALRGLLEHVGIDTEGLSISVEPQGEQ